MLREIVGSRGTAVSRSLRWWSFVLALAGLLLGTGGCSGCGDRATGTHAVAATLVSITVDPPTKQTPAGTTVTFTATETFSDGDSVAKPDDPSFLALEWSTSDATIAVIDATG